MSTSGIIEDNGDCPTDGRNTKKVQFKDKGVDAVEIPVLKKIGGLIEKVAKLDFNTDNRQYDHVKELCSFYYGDKKVAEVGEGLKKANSIVGVSADNTIEFVPWIVVERHPRKNPKESRKSAVKILVSVEKGSKFHAVFSGVNEKEERKDLEDDFLGI
ncbi:hypothetical protein Goshw_014271 [Gossypium schwendimanii]|uniref:Uncharacterized protein n=1 Tax=Gossypium schwendimanii TaxID=34291 RepID=A0A7J9KXK3_GOSSC|nr:hypothetical protein [Gossypium schwendimanii]